MHKTTKGGVYYAALYGFSGCAGVLVMLLCVSAFGAFAPQVLASISKGSGFSAFMVISVLPACIAAAICDMVATRCSRNFA